MAQSRGALSVDVRDRLESVVENIEILLRQVKDSSPASRTPHSSEADFHHGLVSIAQLVSHGCTKMAVVFSKPQAPPPLSECGLVCRQLEQATLQLVSTLYQITPEKGRTLQKQAQSSVLDILTNVKKLVELFMMEGCSINHSKLQGSGTVWKSCDKIQNLSRDNKHAVSKLCLSQLHLLQDAWQEVRGLRLRRGEAEGDELEGFECEEVGEMASKLDRATLEEREGWSERDMEVVDPCMSLIQVAVEFSKLTCSQLIKSEGVVGGHVELDSVAERVLLLSPLVDDMVSDLPAPISPPHLSNLGLALGKQLLEFMDAVDTCEFAPRHGNSTGAPPTARQYRDLTDSALSKLQKSTT